MKRGSRLLYELNSDITSLRQVKCISFFCKWDLMVLPGWEAVLPVGAKRALSVLTHRGLISEPCALDALIDELLNESRTIQNVL